MDSPKDQELIAQEVEKFYYEFNQVMEPEHIREWLDHPEKIWHQEENVLTLNQKLKLYFSPAAIIQSNWLNFKHEKWITKKYGKVDSFKPSQKFIQGPFMGYLINWKDGSKSMVVLNTQQRAMMNRWSIWSDIDSVMGLGPYERVINKPPYHD